MDPRRLTLLRHGSAESQDAWPEDIDRPLTRQGLLEAKEMGRRLLQRGWVPQLILTSPAERTWGTAQVLGKVFDLEEKQVCCIRQLYLATPETLWATIASQPAAIRHLLVCGHNPGLSDLASRFGHRPRRHELRTAGAVTAEWPETPWEALSPRSALHCSFDDPSQPDSASL